MNNEFQWTDELVKEFARYYYYTDKPMDKRFADFIASKQPKPSFATVDDAAIYIGDLYFWVRPDFSIKECECNIGNKDEGHIIRIEKNTFSTFQAAEQYVIENKHCLSLKDLEDVATEDGYRVQLPIDTKIALTNLIKSRL